MLGFFTPILGGSENLNTLVQTVRCVRLVGSGRSGIFFKVNLLALLNLDFKLFSKSRLLYDSRRDEVQRSTT